jgi:hypothetical protein
MTTTARKEQRKHLDQAGHQVFRDLAENPGATIAVDPDLAEHLGAFEENALTPEEAEASSFDEEVVNE